MNRIVNEFKIEILIYRINKVLYDMNERNNFKNSPRRNFDYDPNRSDSVRRLGNTRGTIEEIRMIIHKFFIVRKVSLDGGVNWVNHQTKLLNDLIHELPSDDLKLQLLEQLQLYFKYRPIKIKETGDIIT